MRKVHGIRRCTGWYAALRTRGLEVVRAGGTMATMRTSSNLTTAGNDENRAVWTNHHIPANARDSGMAKMAPPVSHEQR